MISFSLSAPILSISSIWLSVTFCRSFSAIFWSSSVMTESFFIFLMDSMASRRMLRMATLPSSTIFLTCLHSSLRRSPVSSGTIRRMTLPSLEGLMPISDFSIAFSMGPIIFGSHGAITSRRGSGEEMLPTWFSAVGVP